MQVNRKLNALHRIGSHISLDKRKMLLRAFIKYQFSYCRLIWMFHPRTLNNKINWLHEKTLRIKESKFDELLEKAVSFSIHHRNIQTVAIETFKFLNGLSQEILNEIFQVESSVHTISGIKMYEVKTQSSDVWDVYSSPKIWSIVPQELKN